MKTTIILALSLAAVVAAALAAWVMLKPATTPQIVRAIPRREIAPAKNPSPPPLTPTVALDPSPGEQIARASESAPPPPPKADVTKNVAPQSGSGKKPKEPLHDPDARAAMSLVGIDPDAEAYWLEAIFDSSLPDREREDLIEDLNEEGLSDPKHPSAEDLQLIARRIPIVEEVAANVRAKGDEFMAPHVAEVYKDLWNLLHGLEPQ